MVNVEANTLAQKRSTPLGEGIIITIYFILKPLYLFSSGLPQISDMLLIVAAGALLFLEKGIVRFPQRYARWVYSFLLTLGFQVIVQGTWWVVTSDNRMLLMATYYIFNFIAALLCLYIGQKIGAERLKLAICKGCFYSILVTGVGFVLNSGSGIRNAGFFNNPNQLGYYSLLILTIIAFFPDQLPKWQNLVIIVVSIWGNIVSLSKASIIGLAGLAVLYAMFGTKHRVTAKRLLIQIAFLLVILGAIYWFMNTSSPLVAGNRTLYVLRYRIQRMGIENDSSLGVGRGYDRVKEMGVHLLWGMGEGAYYRFRIMPGYEIHATFVNILVSYGIIGLFAYLWLMGKSFFQRGTRLKNLACCSGLILYSLTHNGIRNTLLWILIAAVLQTAPQLENDHGQEILRRN